MCDDLPRRPTPGLEEAVSKFYFEQLDSLNQSKNKRCPGERECRANGPLNMPINRNRETEKVCGECVRFGTKPDRHSPHLAAMLALATRLDKMRRGGASFPYPTSSTSPFFWVCLAASQEGRDRADDARNQREQAERERRQAEERRRQEALARGNR